MEEVEEEESDLLFDCISSTGFICGCYKLIMICPLKRRLYIASMASSRYYIIVICILKFLIELMFYICTSYLLYSSLNSSLNAAS
ncbi:hypothetical protein AQUCO_00800207v1 [Aquilegia coerulea]|uniref:Uncharacterized protein n=1 Tax=Aquilegia coerulea TaxID=218851 RepID=A0A2G5EHQ0_AQUCA|nr:hypothetical protein AQUCO_00800207v1 [Aquilegia coerulea]